MPRYGFNFQWIFGDARQPPSEPDERALDFIAKRGFDFVRIPCNYWFWTTDFDYFHPNETILAYLDLYLEACKQRGLHMNLNLHRAPGYCINWNNAEKHNLWKDQEAQDAFTFLWELFAKRYKGVPNEQISFDLLNEPPSVGDFGMTREIHAQVMRRVAAAIRAIDPEREIVIDGLGAGNIAMPELADLGVIHSTRGYQPSPVSHWGATWWTGWNVAPAPIYPGTEWEGKVWDKETLKAHYAPWREVEAQGVKVHIGEFGCYNQTQNDVALRWFKDLLSIFREYKWGYSLWGFADPFGIIDHGRPGAVYETIDGYNVDRAFMDLLLENRVK
jgi:endoglucanase